MEARQQHAHETAELVAKLRNLDVSKEKCRRWKAQVGPGTIAEFIEFGNNSVQPGYTYFSNLYIQEEGKLHNLCMAFKGAEIFDPLRVKEMSEDATILQADLLARFGFPEFTTEFLEGVKKEIPRYRRMARAHFEWNSLDGAQDYNDKRREQNDRRVHDPTLWEPAYSNWKHDPAERDRRIWLWWRIRVYEVQEFEYIPVALRLVALVQPSSCGIERYFHSLSLFLTTC